MIVGVVQEFAEVIVLVEGVVAEAVILDFDDHVIIGVYVIYFLFSDGGPISAILRQLLAI